MSLETFDSPDQLYLARGDDVNPLRPLFTGDVVDDVAIPASRSRYGGGYCASCHAREAPTCPRVLVAAVEKHSRIGRSAWTEGHAGLMPLPDLLEAGGLWVARLDDIGRARTKGVTASRRLACLSPFGINLMQQRFIWRMTRHQVPTALLQEASAHTFEEADLLEEWNDTICPAGATPDQAAASFEAFLRADCGHGRTLQNDLRDPQRRSSVRIACRSEARRVADQLRPGD